jgi:hypothetical protein
MKMPPPVTAAEVLSIIERLYPDSLLLVRNETGLDEEELQELWRKVAYTFDPRRRLETIEYLLLIMHEARAKDPKRYLHEVFLPWKGFQKRLYTQVMRIADDITRTQEFEAYSDEDAAHIATKVYRPLVSDIFDPFMTLLVATYQFVDGTFVSIEDANLGSGEFNKAELVDARIRQSGGPADLLSGYDSIVRNALSHSGNEGVIYEPGSILFRSVRRGSPPTARVRRWTHQELHLHVIALLELVMSIDAACDIFALDCMDMMIERDTADLVLFHAMTRSRRMEIRKGLEDQLEQIRTAGKLTMKQRLDMLASVLFLQFAERDISCSGVRFDQEKDAMYVDVPVEKPATSDDEIMHQAMYLTRYAVLTRAVFGTLFASFLVEASVNGTRAMVVELPGRALDEYAAEKAGLIDLIADARIWAQGRRVEILIDEAALADLEDARLGPRLPRRGRPVSD